MKNETTMTKITVAKLAPKQTVSAGYRRRGVDLTDVNRFDGFKVGELKFSNLKTLKTHFGVKTLSELEFEVDRLELGSVYAEFYNPEGSYSWAGYLWNGAFRVGTSADRLVLTAKIV